MTTSKERFPQWHKAPTLAGDPQGRQHYDIAADDGENIALVYPSEDSAAETTARANLFVASRELLTELRESTRMLIEQRKETIDSETNSMGEFDSEFDKELVMEQLIELNSQIDKNQAAIRKAEGKDGLD